jgi:hypothetical protein
LPPSLPLWFLWHFLCQFCLHGVFVIVGNVSSFVVLIVA